MTLKHQEKWKILFLLFFYFFYKKVIKSYKKLKEVKKKKVKKPCFFLLFHKKVFSTFPDEGKMRGLPPTSEFVRGRGGKEWKWGVYCLFFREPERGV
jgi:hypothetical protein